MFFPEFSITLDYRTVLDQIIFHHFMIHYENTPRSIYELEGRNGQIIFKILGIHSKQGL